MRELEARRNVEGTKVEMWLGSEIVGVYYKHCRHDTLKEAQGCKICLLDPSFNFKSWHMFRGFIASLYGFEIPPLFIEV